MKNKDNLHQEGPSGSEAEKTPSLEQEEVAQAKRSDGGVGKTTAAKIKLPPLAGLPLQ